MRQLRCYLAMEQVKLKHPFTAISKSDFTSLCGEVLKKPNNTESKCS